MYTLNKSIPFLPRVLVTVLLYVLLLTHVLWIDIPQALSEVMILATLSMMIISFILYGTRNLALIKAAKTGVKEVV